MGLATILTSDQLTLRMLVAISAISVATRVASLAFRRLHQPSVIGELLAGLVLGPTLLGAVPGHLTQWLFPADLRPVLSAMGNFGIVVFMFLIALELDVSGTGDDRGRRARLPWPPW